MKRRQFIGALGGGFLCWYSPYVSAEPVNRPKVVWLLLRGAMDSLHALLPMDDSALMQQRGNFVKPIKNQAYPLARGFALHPALKEFYQLYQRKELLAVVATSSGADTRSHFRAQDILESGRVPADNDSGWLNRAVEAYRGQSLAVAHSVPISLRGRHASQTWYPDNFKQPSDDLYDRLKYLYADDEQLLQSLSMGLATQEKLAEMAPFKGQQQFASLALACGKLMHANDGPDCSMLELDGWDTHQRQEARLNKKFAELDNGLASLREGLGDQWRHTVVIIATEFGRTVAENGTGGTDHGTASALFLAGGAIRGGQVCGDWPGLANNRLYEGRDLAPTSDNRQWISAVLKQHWHLNDSQLARVFPQIEPVDHKLVNRLV